jgi:hypothetical protein
VIVVEAVRDSSAAWQGEQIPTANGPSATDLTMIPEFPENRENNREFFVIFGPVFSYL